jgi:chaperone required for assembly of F1-ATPase
MNAPLTPLTGQHAFVGQTASVTMREILEDLLEKEPLEPTEAARQAMRPRLRRRFYEQVTVVEGEGGFGLALDGRPVKTPARRALAAPTRPLAEALAEEWRAQREHIDPATMPLTRLANSIIDGVADTPEGVAAEVEKYLASDLIFYRAEAPQGLVSRQEAAWDPLIAWASDTLGAQFRTGAGVVHLPQPEIALAAARAAIPRDIWRLGAAHSITTLTGSALIALALLGGRLSVADAWAAGHVDEDWNMAQWGRDEIALERRAYREAEMQAAARVVELLRA